ncbi:endo alpha-1,4 polygalactosaminidase [Azospirillum sp. sgz302134]
MAGVVIGRRGLLGGLIGGAAAMTLPRASGAAPAAAPARSSDSWVVYYADKEPVKAFEPYRLLVLDSKHHPPLRALKDRGKTLLGYISLGEVEQHRPWFDRVKGWGLLSAENPNWPGSFYVDVRDKRWVKLVVEELVPSILRQGFDGIFLDTLDNPPHLERTDAKRWAGMTEGAARLVRAIRANWPSIRIMQNRAYEILPDVAGALDYALGESVYAGWDFAAKKPHLQTEEDYRFQVEVLTGAKRINPKLSLHSLDYWDPADTEGIRRIYALQRANGFSPYVSVVELDRIVPEPGIAETAP